MSRLERLFLNLALFATGGSGSLYALMKYMLTNEDPFSVVNHPWQPALLSIHVLAAPLLLFGFGFIVREHIVSKYSDSRARRGRRMGTLALLALLPMVFSGYLLQVLTSPTGRSVTGVIHLFAGTAFLACYGVHLWLAARGAGIREAALDGKGQKLPVLQEERRKSTVE